MSEVPEDALTAPWWEATRRHRLLLQSCAACAAVQHPPRAICVRCGAAELGWARASGRATLDSFTAVARQILPELPAPYLVARVRLAEGPVLLSNLVATAGERDVRCDMPLTLTWRDLDDGRALPLFTPTSEKEPDHGLRPDRGPAGPA